MWVTWGEPLQGIYSLWVYCSNFTGPLGVVWGTYTGGSKGVKRQFHVYHAYTVPWARRIGVRSLINKTLFEEWKVDLIITECGLPTGGRQFMAKAGYKKDPKTSLMILDKETWRRNKNA